MFVEREISAEQLISEIKDGTTHFINVEAKNGTLAHTDLTDVIFENCWFSDISFYHANLRNCKIVGSNLKCCNFVKADLTNALLVGNGVSGAVFSEAIIDGIVFEVNDYYGATLGRAALDDLVKEEPPSWAVK